MLRQKRGLAIGGPCSSQLASGKCMTPGRFRDNTNLVMFTHTPRELLQASFEASYNLDMQWEGGGDQWITLQGDMTLEPQDPTQHPPHIWLCLADKSLKHTSAHQFLMRYPDAHAPKARSTLWSLVPTLAKNSGWWKPLLRTHLHKWGLEHYMPGA